MEDVKPNSLPSLFCCRWRHLCHHTTLTAERSSMKHGPGLFRNPWKDIEKSMRSSKPGQYYFEPKKKHLESPLSAWFHWEFFGGRCKFRTCDPCSVKTPTFHHFPI
jgi:hypothetical protein